MASNAAKALRSALALNKLDRLSQLLADNLNVEVPEIRPYNRDPQLRQIMRVEAINDLLEKVLVASNVDIEPAPESEEPKLESMTKSELVALAKERGLPVDKSAKKADLIEALSV